MSRCMAACHNRRDNGKKVTRALTKDLVEHVINNFDDNGKQSRAELHDIGEEVDNLGLDGWRENGSTVLNNAK